jgi:GNAT superfamily N-acetyltransferase
VHIPLTFVLENLADHAHLGPTLARLHAAEWGHLYNGPGSTWNEELARQEFADMQREAIPMSILAIDPSTDALLGSISLIADDELHGFEHLTPWLASLFVLPEARGRGIGSALIEAVMDQAARVGSERVYLFTSGQQGYYEDRGWELIDTASAHGHAVSVMTKSCTPATR